MTQPGIYVHPEGTLVERALGYLANGPAGSEAVARDVLWLPRANAAVAERLAVVLLGADPRAGRLSDGRWMLVAGPGGSPAIEQCSFAVVDLETTGGRSQGGDRITEVAVVAWRHGQAELVYESLVNPERPIPSVAAAVTRISDDLVRNQPTFAEIAGEVYGALAGRIFVAHNVGFDWRFVAAEVKRATGLVLEGPRVCTVRLARRLVPGLRSGSLDTLALFFGIEIRQRHRAGPDALATAQLLGRLLALASERGVTTLSELVTLAARRRPRRRRRAHPESVDRA